MGVRLTGLPCKYCSTASTEADQYYVCRHCGHSVFDRDPRRFSLVNVAVLLLYVIVFSATIYSILRG